MAGLWSIAQSCAMIKGRWEMAIQLELFDSEEDVMRREIQEIKIKCDNVRKGLFKRHNELEKFCNMLYKEIQELKAQGYQKEIPDREVLIFSLPKEAHEKII